MVTRPYKYRPYLSQITDLPEVVPYIPLTTEPFDEELTLIAHEAYARWDRLMLRGDRHAAALCMWHHDRMYAALIELGYKRALDGAWEPDENADEAEVVA